MALGNGTPSASRRSTTWINTTSLLLLVAALGGCESTDAGKPPEEPPPPEGAVLLTNANNYTTLAELTPPTIVTASGEDLDISWDLLVRDMQCHDMSPTGDIDKVAFVRFQNVTKEEAAARLTAGELEQADTSGYSQLDTDGTQTSCRLSDLSLFGSEFDIATEYTDSETRVYMMLWGTTTTPGTGARTMAFLEPTEGNNNTRVVAQPGCDENGDGILFFEATLAEPAEIAAGSFDVNWRGVTVDGLGNPLDNGGVTSVLLGFYANMTPEEIEARIFDLEIMATDIWETPHGGGRTTNLQAATHRETGEAFTGFEGHGDGTWLIGLMCALCQNPAPLMLAVLEPVAAAQ